MRQKHVLHDSSSRKGKNNMLSPPPTTQQQLQQHQQDKQQQQQQEQDKQEIDNSYVDGLLSSKLTQMTLKERLNGLHDIHGISEVQETPEMIQNGIDDMNQTLIDTVLKEIEQEKKKSKSGGDSNNAATRRHLPAFYYRLAMMKSPSYVEQLKVSFLRTEEYDGSKAAIRLIRFFQLKAELFGENALVRDLEFERDIGEEGQDAMNCGLFQILPQRDRAGRPILFAYGRVNSSKYSTDTILRCILYVTTCPALQHMESQKSGVVILSYALGQVEAVPGRASAIGHCLFALPMRISAYHLCMNTSALSIPAYLLCSYLENRNICRFKVHTGTPMECIYNLMTFGIPKEVMPVNLRDGSIDLTSHHAMLGALKRTEQLRRESALEQHQEQQHERLSSFMGGTIQHSDNSVSESSSSEEDQSGIDDLLKAKIQGGTGGDASSNIPLSSISSDVQSCWDITSSIPVTQLSTKDLGVKKPKMSSMATPTESASAEYVHTETVTTFGGSIMKTPEKDLIFVPGPMDIIPGKGRKPKKHPGGLRLHSLILKYQEEYDSSTKNEKAILLDVVLKEIKMAGCRFLMVAPDFVDSSNDNNKQTRKDVYVECDDILSKSKISHAFRNLRSRTKLQGRGQEIDDEIDNNNNNEAEAKETDNSAIPSGGGLKKHADSINEGSDSDHSTGAKKRLRTKR